MDRRVVGVCAGLGALLVALLLQQGQEAPSMMDQTRSEAPRRTLAGLAPPLESDLFTAAPHDDVSTQSSPLYRDGERMVALHDPTLAEAVAADHGVILARSPGPSGYALFTGSRADLDALKHDDRIADVARNGIIHGASVTQAQWHHGFVESAAPSVAGDFVVAVIDTGVAYETATRLGVSYVIAPGLASSTIVAPYDFANDDAWANDDHQHGTHIAGIIAANGVTKGIVPGVSLMPIKVLDANNTGTELALIDGINHAVANGADVINMSLSFSEGYQPSMALLTALKAARDAGVVMVAAAGNASQDYTSWPAASPVVLAVGASKMTDGGSEVETAGYSNGNGAVDLMAPGGDIGVDVNGDGYPDGIVAQSIDPTDPTAVGYWLMAGTSQAAAVVTGAAVRALDEGYAPNDVYVVLQDESDDGNWLQGTGEGYLECESTIESSKVAKHFYAAVLPYLEDQGTDVMPKARVALFKVDGTPVPYRTVGGSIWGNGDGTVSCVTDTNGRCTLSGAAVPKLDAQNNPTEYAWAFSVEGVKWNGIHHPRAAMTSSTAFQDLVAGVRADPAMADGVLAWSWTDTTHPVLGNVAAGYTVVNNHYGFAESPLGLVATPAAIENMSVITPDTVLADAHQVDVELIDLDGSGLASIPMGFQQMQLVAVDGTGLNMGGLLLQAQDAHGEGTTLVPMDGNSPFDLLSNTAVSLTGSALGAQLDDGGWHVEGYGGAGALSTSSALSVQGTYLSGLSGMGHGVVAFVE